MDINSEIAELQQLATQSVGEGESQLETLLHLRERVWNVEVALREAQEEKKAKEARLQRLQNQVLEARVRANYIRKEIFQAENVDSEEFDSELVDVDTFKADNPDISVQPEEKYEFLLERFRDEERRRAILNLERRKLEETKKSLQEAKAAKVKEARPLKAKYEVKRAVHQLERIGRVYF